MAFLHQSVIRPGFWVSKFRRHLSRGPNFGHPYRSLDTRANLRTESLNSIFANFGHPKSGLIALCNTRFQFLGRPEFKFLAR